MATKIIHKKSSVAGSAPSSSDIAPGELALNLADKKIYSKQTDGTIIEIASYSDANVNTHLNTGTANTGEVLSWTGTDYDWVASSGAGGSTKEYFESIIDGGASATAYDLFSHVLEGGYSASVYDASTGTASGGNATSTYGSANFIDGGLA